MISRREVLLAGGACVAAGAAGVLAQAQEQGGGRAAKALVFEIEDKWTGAVGAAELLKGAGFTVEKLPLKQSPYRLEADLILLGSFVSESEEYKAYMAEYAKDLYAFVDRGKVLVQMAQADQTEGAPPFLPSTHGAKRVDADFREAMIVSAKNPLMKGVPQENGVVRWDRQDRRTIWESLVEHDGFEVIIAAEPEAVHPGLMEGAYGQGRIILSAMDFDKAKVARTGERYGSETQARFAAAFFKNLFDHAINVREGKTQALNVTPKPQTVQAFVPGSWTLAVLPDTQVYALRYPGLFTMQTEWVVRNKEKFNIQYVLQLGDITNNNTIREWENARMALGPVYGKVPLAMVTGNHDYGPSGDATTRETHFNKYFPVSEAKAQATFGGVMKEDSLENSYHLFTAGGVDWIIVALEWSPRDEVVEWADGVMKQHAKRRGILITHAYMNNNDRRYDHTDKANPQDFNPHLYKTPGSKNDGQQLWDKLVKHHDFALVHNGHVLGDGTGYLASKNDKGRTCHQILANYQMRTLGGEGYLRLIEFRPDGKSVQVKTYSPLYDRHMLVAHQQFGFELD